MKKKPYNYTVIHNGNTTIAYSTFAGKTVKGYAKLNPKDEANPAVGEKLAKARCGLKIAKKRRKWAESQYNKAKAEMLAAIQHFHKMESYAKDSIEEVLDAEDYLKEVVSDIEEV
jgi:hypothetical protein